MKIVPMAVAQQQQANAPAPENKVAKAIEAFKTGASTYDRPNPLSQPSSRLAAQEYPVADANNISAEEVSAIRGQSNQQVSDINVDEQEAAQESPSEVVEEPKKVEETPESRRFAQLARQEKALRAKQHAQDLAFKQREAALAEREAKLTQAPKEDRSQYISRDQLKQDTLQALADAGVSYDELTQQILNQTPKDPRVEAHISRLEAKLAALEAKAEESVKQVSEQQKQAYDAAVKQISVDAKNLVQRDPAFETIKETGSVKDVVELITQTYEQDGILLTVEEAAQQVEDYLVEEAMKITRIGKIKQRLEQAVQPVKAGTQTPKPPQTQPAPMKTLTNATSSSRQLSARERALLAFKGEKY